MAYYPSILGQCPDCCACPQPELLYKVRSASKSKCGTTDPDNPTTPPTVFQKYTTCGAVYTYEYTTYCQTHIVYSCDIRCHQVGYIYDGKYYASEQLRDERDYTLRPGWGSGTAHFKSELTHTLEPTGADPNVPGHGPCFAEKTVYSGGWNYTKEPEDPSNPDGMTQGSGSCTVDPVTGKFNGSFTYSDGTTATITNDDGSFFWSLMGGFYNGFDEAIIPPSGWNPLGDELVPPDDEYSDEATTSALEGDTAAALPDWPAAWTSGFYTGATLAYRYLESDERTLNITDGQYCFRFKAPKVGAGKCYKVGPWVERFIPRLPDGSEGDPVDTVKGPWSWDGSLPDDYDPDDYTTWPLSDVFDVSVPGANGRVILGYYTDEEDPGTFLARVPTAVCTGCS